MNEVGWYRAARDLFVEAVAGADGLVGVPACPGWSVHDLVAHQVHQLQGACDGTFPVKDSREALIAPDARARREAQERQDEWIARGVRAYEAIALDAMMGEWAELVVDAPAAALTGLFPDVWVHLFDLLGAVGSRAHRDHPLVVPVLRFWAGYSTARLEQAGAGALRLDLVLADGARDAIGGPDAAVVVEGTPFELLRAITGRRSLRQAQSLRWRPVDVAIERVSVYGWRPEALVE